MRDRTRDERCGGIVSDSLSLISDPLNPSSSAGGARLLAMHDDAEEVIDEQQPKGPGHGGQESDAD